MIEEVGIENAKGTRKVSGNSIAGPRLVARRRPSGLNPYSPIDFFYSQEVPSLHGRAHLER